MTREELIEQCQWYIGFWKENRPQYIVRSGIRMTYGKQQYIKKLIHWKELDATYDRTKSVRQNIALGINASESTLYRYCSERCIPTDPQKGMTKQEKRAQKRAEKEGKIEKFKVLYNPGISVRKNKAIMEKGGLFLSSGTIQNYIGLYCSNITQPTLEEDIVESVMNFNDLNIGYTAPDFINSGFVMPQLDNSEVSDATTDFGEYRVSFSVPKFYNSLWSCM